MKRAAALLAIAVLCAPVAQARSRTVGVNEWHGAHEAKLGYSCGTVRDVASRLSRERLEALAVQYNITPAQRREAEACLGR